MRSPLGLPKTDAYERAFRLRAADKYRDIRTRSRTLARLMWRRWEGKPVADEAMAAALQESLSTLARR